MSKGFIAIVIALVVGSTGFIIMKKSDEPVTARPGTEQPDNGRNHVDDGTVKYGGPEAPTSGDHSSPAPWQYFEQEIPDMNVIHNMEHGGIYISYRPDLPPEQIAKIKAMFFKPYSNTSFTPTKAIAAPRAANDAPIIMSSWRRSMKLDSFDEKKMKEYYLRNVGKSPEPAAG